MQITRRQEQSFGIIRAMWDGGSDTPWPFIFSSAPVDIIVALVDYVRSPASRVVVVEGNIVPS